MSLDENKQIVQAFYNASNQGDMDRLLALLADDIIWNNIGSTRYSGTYAGKESLLANLIGQLFGQLKAGINATLDNMIAEGDFVVVQLRGQAETVEGRPYNNTYCHVFRIHSGRIAEMTEYCDTALVNTVFGQ
jgi:uncharacterized protein